MEIHLSGWEHEEFNKSIRNKSLIQKVEVYKSKVQELNTVGSQHIKTDSALTNQKKRLEKMYELLETEKIIVALSIAEHLTK